MKERTVKKTRNTVVIIVITRRGNKKQHTKKTHKQNDKHKRTTYKNHET